jgi:DNA-binding CsgD family transcriptional regulator
MIHQYAANFGYDASILDTKLIAPIPQETIDEILQRSELFMADFNVIANWHEGVNGEFIVSSDGVRHMQYTADELKRVNAEASYELRKYMAIQLNFPCNRSQIVEFNEAIGRLFQLPEGFIEEMPPDLRSARKVGDIDTAIVFDEVGLEPKTGGELPYCPIDSPQPLTGNGRAKFGKWSNEELKKLLDESMRGDTQAQLAERYDVKRQRVSALLKKARDQFGTKSKTETSMLAQATRKVTF